MQEFDLNAKINCTMGVAVVAENRKLLIALHLRN